MPLLPLEGWTVGITADRRADDQAELLRRKGAAIVHGPTMATQYLGSDETLRRATAAVASRPPHYLVATTGIGMRAWLEAAQAWGLGEGLLAALAGARIVVRGPKSAGAVQAAGLEVWRASPNERLDGLMALLLAQPLAGRRVAVQEAGAEADGIGRALAAAGAEVVAVPVYRWRVPDDTGPALRLVEAACAGRLDAVTFTSAPAVQNLFSIAAGHGRAGDLCRALNTRVTAACVGAVCAEAAAGEGLLRVLEPPLGRLGLMVRALVEHLEGRRRTLVLAGTEVVVQGAAVRVGDRTAALPPLERAVLGRLAERPGAVVSRPQLLEAAWGTATAEPHLLEAAVTRLRRRLGPCGAAVRPVAGRGYRLDTPAGRPAPAPVPDAAG